MSDVGGNELGELLPGVNRSFFIPIVIHEKNWVVATQIFLEFSPRALGFHDPIWRAYFSNGLVKNHQLENDCNWQP